MDFKLQVEKYKSVGEENTRILEEKSFAFFDIETTNLNASIGRMLCASIVPLEGNKIKTFKSHKNDRELCAKIRDELEKYDYVVTYYGSGFDIPFLNTRLLKHGRRPLKSIRHLDMYYTVRSHLRMHSKRLDAVCEMLFGETKKTRLNGDIWDAAASGSKSAMDYIATHCEMDVLELRRVFWQLVDFRNLGATPLKGGIYA